jgi:hypothetical protein
VKAQTKPIIVFLIQNFSTTPLLTLLVVLSLQGCGTANPQKELGIGNYTCMCDDRQSAKLTLTPKGYKCDCMTVE